MAARPLGGTAVRRASMRQAVLQYRWPALRAVKTTLHAVRAQERPVKAACAEMRYARRWQALEQKR